MIWNGEKLKIRAKELNILLEDIAERLDVTRQTINHWISGQIPKGNHLLLLCKMLSVDPGFFFNNEEENIIVPVVHRIKKTAKINPQMQEKARELASEYEILFTNSSNIGFIPVDRSTTSDKSAKIIAQELRKTAGLTGKYPITYYQTFELLQKLGIFLIFRYFPSEIKSYAFYTKIANHRVVFINNNTNILDLIFPLLHESVHALRDDKINNPSKKEEDFCDLVANYIQFPDDYVLEVYHSIKNLSQGQQINILKEYARKHAHSLYGIAKRIEEFDSSIELNVGGADTNLKQEFPTIGYELDRSPDAHTYISKLAKYTPNFFHLLVNQLDTMSSRKLAEILGFTSVMDAKEIKQIMLDFKSKNKNLKEIYRFEQLTGITYAGPK